MASTQVLEGHYGVTETNKGRRVLTYQVRENKTQARVVFTYKVIIMSSPKTQVNHQTDLRKRQFPKKTKKTQGCPSLSPSRLNPTLPSLAITYPFPS